MYCTVSQLYALVLSVLLNIPWTAASFSSTFGLHRSMGQVTQPVAMPSRYVLPSVSCLTELRTLDSLQLVWGGYEISTLAWAGCVLPYLLRSLLRHTTTLDPALVPVTNGSVALPTLGFLSESFTGLWMKFGKGQRTWEVQPFRYFLPQICARIESVTSLLGDSSACPLFTPEMTGSLCSSATAGMVCLLCVPFQAPPVPLLTRSSWQGQAQELCWFLRSHMCLQQQLQGHRQKENPTGRLVLLVFCSW